MEHATQWVLENGYRNVIIEIDNECSVRAYDHDILKCDRVHELIERARAIAHDGRRLYVSTSLAGGQVPGANIVAAPRTMSCCTATACAIRTGWKR